MRAEGMDLIYHVRELSVMGFAEVIRHLPVLRSVEQTLEAILTVRRPDVLMLIDYPGFNMRFAAKARRMGIKILYYISPQVWAWRSGRAKKMASLIDKMMVVFPFEKELYEKVGVDVEFVGHPLLEVLGESQKKEDFCKRHGFDPTKPIIGLFPGSRRQELERIFPAMLGAGDILREKHGVHVAVGAASVLASDYVKSFLADDSKTKVLHNATYDLMANADVALVTSGTATLETAYYGTPMVVVYRTSWLTYVLGRLLVRVKNIGLVNIVAEKTLVPELIQTHVNPLALANAAEQFLINKNISSTTRKALSIVKERLGTPGASRRVVDAIIAMA